MEKLVEIMLNEGIDEATIVNVVEALLDEGYIDEEVECNEAYESYSLTDMIIETLVGSYKEKGATRDELGGEEGLKRVLFNGLKGTMRAKRDGATKNLRGMEQESKRLSTDSQQQEQIVDAARKRYSKSIDDLVQAGKDYREAQSGTDLMYKLYKKWDNKLKKADKEEEKLNKEKTKRASLSDQLQDLSGKIEKEKGKVQKAEKLLSIGRGLQEN